MLKNIIERAFELAATGQFEGLTEIKPILRREGYSFVDNSFSGLQVRRDLQAICREARGLPPIPRALRPVIKSNSKRVRDH